MYYEPYSKKKKQRRRRRRRGGCLFMLLRPILRLIAVGLALAIAAAAGLYYLPVGLFMIERGGELSPTDGLPTSPLNVLLLGVDTLSDGGQRSDTMMIVSVDRSGLKLTSLQRDLMAQIPGYGAEKINAAYAHGGAELAVQTVNQTFQTNILRYAVVDFTAVVRMVDALGGIEIDITEAEMVHINKNVRLSGRVFAPLGYTATELTVYGEGTHLDGLQALAYARIRKLDSDFMRTSRQRAVIRAILEKIGASLWHPARLVRFVQTALDGVETNLSTLEILSLGEKALLSGSIESLRLPANGTFDDDGSALTMTDESANIEKLREFLYGGAA